MTDINYYLTPKALIEAAKQVPSFNDPKWKHMEVIQVVVSEPIPFITEHNPGPTAPRTPVYVFKRDYKLKDWYLSTIE